MTGHEIGAALGVAVLSAVASGAGFTGHRVRVRPTCSQLGFIGAAVDGCSSSRVFALLRMPATRVTGGGGHMHMH